MVEKARSNIAELTGSIWYISMNFIMFVNWGNVSLVDSKWTNICHGEGFGFHNIGSVFIVFPLQHEQIHLENSAVMHMQITEFFTPKFTQLIDLSEVRPDCGVYDAEFRHSTCLFSRSDSLLEICSVMV